MPEANDSLEDAYAAMRADGSYQFELPTDPEIVLPDSPPENDAGWSFFQAVADFISALGPLWRVLLIVAGVLLVGYIVYSVVRAIMDRRGVIGDAGARKGDDRLAEVDLRPDEVFSADLLRRADALADAGDFDGAVRLILHSSFQDMQQRVRNRIGASLTGREIGELGRMPESSRSALRRLIDAVERSAFAGRHLTREDYLAARGDYDAFAQRAEGR